MDSLLQMASREKEEERSLELYQQAKQIPISEAACLPLRIAQSYVLIKKNVIGYRLNLLGFAMLNEVSVGPK